MGRLVLANAFSLNMLPREGIAFSVCARRVTVPDAETIVKFHGGVDECVIGHEGTAKIAMELLGLRELECTRKPVTLEPGDVLLVIMLSFRPEEGKVYSYEELRELQLRGMISWWLVGLGVC